MATSSRGEGVALLPAARWTEYVLPPQLLTRSPGHMLDWVRACKGGDPGCSDFSISAPYAEWLALIADRLPRPRQTGVGRQEYALHQQRRSQQVRQARSSKRAGN